MTIYVPSTTKPKIGRPNINYRAIYEAHHGPIPREPDGRSYEVHHKDGNCFNNHPSNLVALTIQEHYAVHADVEDWRACHAIAIRMKLSHAEISALAKKSLTQRVNPFAKRPDGSSVSKDKVENGTHHLLKRSDGSSVASDLVKAGTHHLLRRPDGTSHATDAVLAGTHNFLKREDGTSQSQEAARARVKKGFHNFQGDDSPSQTSWECPKCGMTGKGKSNFTKSHGDACRFFQRFHFQHQESGDIIIMTHGKFCQTFGVPVNHFQTLLNNPSATRKGWFLITPV